MNLQRLMTECPAAYRDLIESINEDAGETRELLETLSKEELFERWCNYEGLINYGDKLLKVWDAIDQCEENPAEGFHYYYVSMVKDLLGVFLRFEADSDVTVRQYLKYEYLQHGTYKIPWCSIYTEIDRRVISNPIILNARCGRLISEQFAWCSKESGQ